MSRQATASSVIEPKGMQVFLEEFSTSRVLSEKSSITPQAQTTLDEFIDDRANSNLVTDGSGARLTRHD